MGLSTASQLVDAGVSVTLVGRSRSRLDAAREKLGVADTATTFQCDLASQEDVDRLIVHVRDKMKEVKYLINAAGIFLPKDFLSHEGPDYDAYLSINCATFFLTQQVAKNMAANGGGSIVNVGSMWAHQAIKATPSSS